MPFLDENRQFDRLMRQPQELRSHMEKPIKLNMEGPNVPGALDSCALSRAAAHLAYAATTTHSRTTHIEFKGSRGQVPLEYSYFQPVGGADRGGNRSELRSRPRSLILFQPVETTLALRCVTRGVTLRCRLSPLSGTTARFEVLAGERFNLR